MGKATQTITITRQKLYRMIWEKPLSTVAEELGISANGLSRICNRMCVPYPPKGYWARVRAGHILPKPPLPPEPEKDHGSISISPERSPSRRTRTRMSPEDRRAHLIEIARRVIVSEGLHQASMKRIAREAGVSESQAHNYFSREALLVEIAREELHAIEESRRAEMDRGADSFARRVLGTMRYLEEVERRGVLIQILLGDPGVRQALKQERKAKSLANMARISQTAEKEHGVPADITKASTRILTAVSLRAGRLLAKRKVSLSTAQALTIPIIVEGNRRVVEVWGNSGALTD